MSERDPECLFCRIVTGEIPADIVHRDERVVAFRDIDPQAPTHVLAIPTRHVASAAELTADDGDMLADLFGALRAVAAEEGLSGYRIVTNIGAEAGQSVFHLHFHLLGGRRMGWPPG